MAVRDEANPPVLSIGIMLGGTRERDLYWDPELTRLLRQVKAAGEGIASSLHVNVVFHVGGELIPVEFEGVRTGTLTRKTMHLMVQAAVPPEPVEDRRGVLLRLLHDAVLEAEALAKRRKIADGLPEVRAIVQAVADKSPDGRV